MKFDLAIPTRIHFGCGMLEDALKKEEKLCQGNILIVSSETVRSCGVADRIVAQLEQFDKGREVVIFSEVTSNPKISEVNAGIALAIHHDVKLVIGVGGGSVLDAAKAIAVGAGAGESMDDYFFGKKCPDNRTLPILAIPTTAGTGSELSKSAILSCPQKGMKGGVRGEAMYPAAAIVDPELTYSVPLQTTMETGFDVLAHAVESYLSLASNCFTRMLSEQAIAIVARNLRILAKDITDQEAREKMSYASMIMGINLGNASTVLPHRMQYPVGALTDTSHGKGLAALYPAWIDLTYSYSTDLFNRVGELLSGEACTSKEQVLEAFENFMSETCGMPKLSELGLKAEDAEKLSSLVSGNIQLDPAGDVNGIVRDIYKRAIA